MAAPTVAEFRGSFYLAGNGSGLYRSAQPLGPWEFLGDFTDNQGKRFSPFDPMIFVDDDGRVYFYYSGGSTKGIYGVELDPKDLTHFAGAPVHFFSFEPAHIWERFGDANEDSGQSWIEGPWMTRKNGVYYLQYSAPGTEWKTYPVGFDAEGRLVVHGPTETPQWAPGVKAKAWLDNDSGSLPLTINKETFAASSSAPGRDPAYAIDNNVRTWWEAAAGDTQPWLAVDLTHEFTIDSSRILFSDNRLSAASGVLSGPYRYKVEASADGRTWRAVLDKTANTVENNIEFDEIPPVRARWVRLTVSGAPKNLPVGILEFTVFGRP